MRLRSPVRLTIVIVTFFVILWMVYNFIIALQTGETFSFFGNGRSSNDVETFVVAGVDADGYRTDLILLCQVNNPDNSISIMQIPRDTRVNNKRGDKKINSAYYSGFDTMSKEIESVTGIKPEHYVMVSFEGFKDIINALGGVKVDVPIRMKYDDPVQKLKIDLKPGKQRLNGKKAEMFMRFRKNNDGTGYPDGDVGRLKAQQQLYTAVSDKLFSPIGVLKSPAVFLAVKSNTNTDFTTGEIFGLMRDALRIGKENVHIFSLPGEGRYIGGVSYFVPNKGQTDAIINENFVAD